LVYAVREPFPTHFTAAGLVFGILDPGESVILESEMSEGGAIFSDGIVEDFVPFNAGATVSIASAQKRVRLIVEAPHVARPTGKANLSHARRYRREQFYLIATAFGGDAIPPSRFIGTETIMNSYLLSAAQSAARSSSTNCSPSGMPSIDSVR
jgi:hypothetical protein